MQENLIKAYSDQAIKQYQSIIQLNTFLLTNFEKGVDFQLHAINDYSQLNFEQAINLATLKGAEGSHSFSAESSASTTPFNQYSLQDSQKSTNTPQELISDIDYLWQII
jgi:phasin family protein